MIIWITIPEQYIKKMQQAPIYYEKEKITTNSSPSSGNLFLPELGSHDSSPMKTGSIILETT
uniref:Uncharacterized protein n=1 Tax=Arion vulgaris TaxID=1028688 RepID=A0A0B6ZIG2_9EUPU